MNQAPRFSVLIGTYNGEQKLPTALDALEAQTVAAPFEVIVIDDASTDDTAAIAARDGVTVITLDKNMGHGHTLNVGLEHAHGEFIVLMDDDCVPPPTWLERLSAAWGEVPADVTVIGGPVRPWTLNTLNRRYVAYREPLRAQEADLHNRASLRTRLRHAFAPPPQPDLRRAIYYAVGANMSVRTEAARDVGGFTERRGAGEEESIAVPLRARFGESTVQYFPDVVMFHDFGASLGDSFRRSRMYGRSHGRDWVRDRSSPRVRPLPIVASTVVAGAALVSIPVAVLLFPLAPLLMYRKWVHYLRGHRDPEVLVYPYLEAIEEFADNVGFLQGAVAELTGRAV